MRKLNGVGIYAGGGAVQGIAIVVHSAQEAGERLHNMVNGRPIVLVCANSSSQHQLDLLRRVRGVVAEASVLFPGTLTLARELGLPVVAGLGAAIDTIPDGKTIFVDGASGTVEVIG